MKVDGWLEKAQFENIASATSTPTPTGRVYADTTAASLAVPRFYDGTSWKAFVLAASGTSYLLANLRSSVYLDTTNGFGSTGSNAIRRFTNSTVTGTDITYTDSVANGATITIVTDGIYSISYADTASAAAVYGLSKNSAQLTTVFDSITQSTKMAQGQVNVANGVGSSAVFTGFLAAGTVIRPHFDGSTSASSATKRAYFNIAKVGT